MNKYEQYEDTDLIEPDDNDEEELDDDLEENDEDVDITKDGPALKALAAAFLDSEIKCPNFHNGGECKPVILTLDGRVGGLDFKCSECLMSFCEADMAAKWLANCTGYPEGCVYYRKSQEGKTMENRIKVRDNSEINIPADIGADAVVTDVYIRAVNLNRRIITAAQLTQQSLYDMCMGFKEMRDSKLYKELGYSEFDDYCKNEVGMSDRQAYKYISIVEKLPANLVNSGSLIGTRKLYLLTTLSEEERTEITENTDLENTTVKQLEQQIKTLRAEKDKAVAEKSAAEAQTAAKNDTITELEKTKQQLDERIRKLQNDIKELENRPVECVVETREVIPPDYITRDAYENMVKTYTEQLDKADEENLEEKHRAHAEKTELEKRLAEVEKQLEEAKNAEVENSSDTAEVFKAYLSNAYNSLNMLVQYVQEHTEYIPKVSALVDNIKKSMEVTA